MPDTINVLIVGVGGQGTILAGKVLARAAVLSGLDVKFSEIHGMAQRGGSVVTQVRIGERVYAPVIDPGCADCILAFEQLEALRWIHMLRDTGRVVMSSQRIDPAPVLMGQAAYPDAIPRTLAGRAAVAVLDAAQIATRVGNPRASNIVLLGRLARDLPFGRELWDQALADAIPDRYLQVNVRAFAEGWDAV